MGAKIRRRGRSVLKKRDARDPRELNGAWTRFQRHAFPAPAPDLASFVNRYWIVEFDYDEPYRQLVVPYPFVHMTFWNRRAPEVYGVASGHVVKVLEGTGRVFGVEFRPGGFRRFWRSAVSELTDRAVAVSDVPGLRAVAAPPGPVDVPAVETWLRSVRPPPDPTAEWVAGVVEMIAADPEIARVDELASRCGSSVRRLQRLFAEYVGVGPKWVIRRYRLHEVTERMAVGGTTDWARLAADLGYADQSHFARDFAAMFGESPTHYAMRY
jgi:AraC-like DNA-binding protein